MSAPLIALDDFAGTGWGVACRALGIVERGVEIMPEARATREANGFVTVGADIWAHLEATASAPLAYDLLISSPPCQTFSMAGGGAGRRALDDVVALIDSGAYRDLDELRAFGDAHDPRTALVLTPLVRAYRDAPTYIVLEQVPPVLPVWQRIAEELRRWGYSVAVGVLNAEQYGVPQTRRRAVLIARADGVEARLPSPTHSRYYSRDPKRLDPGVLPWVSMAEALGWGMTARPFVTAGNAVGRAEGIGGSGGKAAVNREKDRGDWLKPEGLRGAWGMTERPYPTIAPGTGAGGTDPMAIGGSGARKTIAREKERGAWLHGETGEALNLDPEKPATTVQGDPRLTSREHHYHGEQNATSTRVTIAEAAALQSYPLDFDWSTGINGKTQAKTKAFLQIGNAVPPLLAAAILATLTETSTK